MAMDRKGVGEFSRIAKFHELIWSETTTPWRRILTKASAESRPWNEEFRNGLMEKLSRWHWQKPLLKTRGKGGEVTTK
jgi:hypothetical protein